MDIITKTIQVTLISAVIGLCVGAFFQFINAEQILPGIINGAISGAIIGFISQYCFMIVYIKFRQHPVLAFAIVIIIIAIGTTSFCLLWKAPFPIPGIPIILVSEILGISATAILFRNYTRLNNQLRGKIKELNGKID
jgi:hypothetical protein